MVEGVVEERLEVEGNLVEVVEVVEEGMEEEDSLVEETVCKVGWRRQYEAVGREVRG